jgi:hypothetical protein
MRLRQRAGALLVALAVALTLPSAAPRSADTCAPGCPMHARRDDGPKPHCHRTPAADDGVCVRSACGHAGVVDGFVWRALRTAPVGTAHAPVGAPLPLGPCVPHSLVELEPPTPPPRPARA